MTIKGAKAVFLCLMLGASATASARDTVAARISGLVCDLCVGGLRSELSKLPHVTATAIALKDGVVAVEVSQAGVSDEQIKRVLVEAGYTVHAMTHTPMTAASINSNPAEAAKSLWAGGGSEQTERIKNTPAGDACPAPKTATPFGATPPGWVGG